MRPYELLFMLSPELSEEDTEAAIERISGILQQNGGEIDQIDRWGKRRLAYEIQGHKDANYSLINFKAEPGATNEVSRSLDLTEDVLRYIVVRQDEE